MQIGTRINALELVERETKMRKVVDGAVTEEWRDTEMTWRCDCGKTKRYWEKDLPKAVSRLKLELNDCGCGISRKKAAAPTLTVVPSPVRPMPPRGRRKSVVSVSLPGETLGAVEEYAQERRLNISHAVDELLISGLANQ